jgi:ADP-ribosylglycohydrolase
MKHGKLAATMLPIDYHERVYAGVLGKIIGVDLGRPFEGWSYERITGR